MRITLLLIAFLTATTVYSQDTTKLKQIDALVHEINASTFTIQRDTIKNDKPDIGLSMRTYLTTVVDGTQLKKYINNVYVTTEMNGTKKQMVSTNTFYFDQNQLIKVEEFISKDDKKIDAFWYHADDQPIHYTFRSEKSPERAQLLLQMAKSMIAKLENK